MHTQIEIQIEEYSIYAAELVEVFQTAFSDGEGPSAGEAIAGLVSSLIATTPSNQLYGFVAKSQTNLIGGIFFSKFFLASGRNVFILSPVAVATEHQGAGVGQALIGSGLRNLQSNGVELVITYGDPAYYKKLGFQPISEQLIPAPFKLSQPHGWMAQRFDGGSMTQEPGVSRCVNALMDPQYW